MHVELIHILEIYTVFQTMAEKSQLQQHTLSSVDRISKNPYIISAPGLEEGLQHFLQPFARR